VVRFLLQRNRVTLSTTLLQPPVLGPYDKMKLLLLLLLLLLFENVVTHKKNRKSSLIPTLQNNVLVAFIRI